MAEEGDAQQQQQQQQQVKRILSKDIHEGAREEKKSKMGSGSDLAGASGAATRILAEAAEHENLDPPPLREDDDGAPFPDDVRRPESSRASTASSLSDGEGGRRRGGSRGDDRRPEVILAPTKGGALAREASAGGEGSSSDGGNSASEGNSTRGASIGNWGWFEEVHDTSQGFLPGGSGGAPLKGGGEAGPQEKKRGGLLHIGSEIMQGLQSIVSERRDVDRNLAVTAPTYVLEESLSSQKLWKQTAGNRPPQPVEERAFFEQMWAQNFTRSKVRYDIPVEVLTASTPISISPFNDDGFGEDGAGPHGNLSNYNLAAPFAMKGGDDHQAAGEVKAAQADAAEATLNQHLNQGMSNGAVEMYFDPNRPKDYNLKTLGPHHHHHTLVNKKVKGAGEESDLTVLVRGDNVFGTTVSKSFPRTGDAGEPTDGIDTVSVSIASYRVVESKKHGKYAQYLVIFCDGNFRNTVGVWKRYSDFSELSRKVTHGHSESCAAVVTGLNPLSASEDHDVEILPNAITSWRLLKKRQRWYRCLDAGYLSLKVFLLERFLHDILFESSNPQILRDFVGVTQSGLQLAKG